MEPMTEEEFQGWMKMVNTQMLELILLEGAGKPDAWFTQPMTDEVKKRRAALERKG